MINSVGKITGTVEFPQFSGTRIYMAPITKENFRDGIPEQYHLTLGAMLDQVPQIGMKDQIFVTIDEKHLMPNTQHRRGGAHIDGNFIFDWGGGDRGGWMSGVSAGRQLSARNHKLQYGSKRGGILMASNYSACQVWVGDIEGSPEQGGDVSHLDLSGMESFMLPAGQVLLGNSSMIHQGHTVQQEVNRQLIRVTMNPEFNAFA